LLTATLRSIPSRAAEGARARALDVTFIFLQQPERAIAICFDQKESIRPARLSENPNHPGAQKIEEATSGDDLHHRSGRCARSLTPNKTIEQQFTDAGHSLLRPPFEHHFEIKHQFRSPILPADHR
jgi:hypothetical protein